MKKGRLRSLIAVLAAFVVTRSLVLAADFLVFRMFPAKFDDAGSAHDMKILIAMLCYSLVFYILGGYIAAAIAPDPKRRHAVVLGILIFAFGASGTASKFGAAPVWFHIAGLAITLPAAALGGR